MTYDLFPEIAPYQSGHLDVDDLHKIYWEVSGNPQGVPVVFLHGGPGAGASAKSRRYFDPAFYKIVVFDQRGAGRSLPHGEMRQNTTPLLIQDMERLREFLNIEAWVLFGGSWGCTLALCYAIQHPRRCLHLILRGIFLCRPLEIEWFIKGVRYFYPDAWTKLVDVIPLAERGDLLKAFRKRVLSDDPAVYEPAVKAYSGYEATLATVLPAPELVESFEGLAIAFSLARAECHYFYHDIFMGPNYILDNAAALQDLSGILIQGRCDMVCPPVSAWELHQAWPKSKLIMVEGAGHTASEPGLQHYLLKATTDYQSSYKSC